MIKHHTIPFLVAAIAVTPFATSAGQGSPVRIDSDLTFSLRITGEGEETERNGILTSRFTTARMGAREVLAALEKLAVFPVADEGEEGREDPGFSRGARLVATPDRGVWVVDRRGFPEFDASPYVEVYVGRKGQVVSGTTNDNNGDQNLSTQTRVSLYVNLPDMMVPMDTAETPSGNSTEVSGQGIERYSRRTNRQGTTETVRVNARTAGTGNRSGEAVMAEGTVSMSGRDLNDEI